MVIPKPTEIGPVRQQLINRAHRSGLSLIYVGDYREMRAARKLCGRGVLVQCGVRHSRLFLLRAALEAVTGDA